MWIELKGDRLPSRYHFHEYKDELFKYKDVLLIMVCICPKPLHWKVTLKAASKGMVIGCTEPMAVVHGCPNESIP